MNRSPLKAIRLHCIDCSGGSQQEVRLCVMPDCPLYPFRFGMGIERALKLGKDIGQDKEGG